MNGGLLPVVRRQRARLIKIFVENEISPAVAEEILEEALRILGKESNWVPSRSIDERLVSLVQTAIPRRTSLRQASAAPRSRRKERPHTRHRPGFRLKGTG